MNTARLALLQAQSQQQQETRLEATAKLRLCRVPPKRREIATLVDWIADHPSAKTSKSLRLLQESYLESIGVL